MSPTIHLGFRTTEEAYDASQTNEDIHDGDILVVDFVLDLTFIRRHSVAILVKAWPTLVSGVRGQFHLLSANNADGWSELEDGLYIESYDTAKRIVWTGE